MNNKFIYFLLLLNILVADSYWLLPWILSTVLFVFPMYFVGIGEHKSNLVKYNELVKPFIILFTYVTIMDVFREADAFVSVYTFISVICTILSAIYLKNRSKYLTWYFIFFLLLNFFVQLIQMTGLRVTGGSLLSPLGFIEYAEVDLFDSSRGFRYSGLYTNLVALAFMCGIFISYFWILYAQSKEKKYLYFVLIAIGASVLTNTRAVLFFIVPVIILADFIVKKKISWKIVGLCIVFASALQLLQYTSGYNDNDSSMRTNNLEEDGGVVDRVQGNLFGTVGTLYLSPIFGIPVDQQDKAIREGYSHIGLVYGSYFVDHVTFHNLPLYYLRVYGIIGFLLFLWAYWKALLYAYRQSDPYDRQYMLTALIFFFVYNLSHNMKVTYLIFWLTIMADYQFYRKKIH